MSAIGSTANTASTHSVAHSVAGSGKKVCIVGSGNWGTVVAKIIGNNVINNEAFDNRVTMYVYEEMVEGVKLTEIINLKHENIKYLPGVKLPENVVAVPDIAMACEDADYLVFVIPHQFMAGICKQMVGKTKPTAVGVSLIKGLDASGGKLDLISNIIRKVLKIECAVLMGANVANDVAQENYCEATIGCKSKDIGKALKDIFQSPYFRITVVPDEEAVEVCGALKNVIALGAGFVDGLRYGDNTKAALMRLGLMEMIEFCKRFFPGCKVETFLQSCGIADLVTTCYSGRNRKVAEAFAAGGSGKTLEELEQEMLNGQKLQGPPTAAEIFEIIKQRDKEEGKDWLTRFPIMTTVHKISIGAVPPSAILTCMMSHPEHI